MKKHVKLTFLLTTINTIHCFSELDDFLQELDEDVEGMQSTILFLQQELKAAKETITNLERENYLLKNGNGASSSNNGNKPSKNDQKKLGDR